MYCNIHFSFLQEVRLNKSLFSGLQIYYLREEAERLAVNYHEG